MCPRIETELATGMPLFGMRESAHVRVDEDLRKVVTEKPDNFAAIDPQMPVVEVEDTVPEYERSRQLYTFIADGQSELIVADSGNRRHQPELTFEMMERRLNEGRNFIGGSRVLRWLPGHEDSPRDWGARDFYRPVSPGR